MTFDPAGAVRVGSLAHQRTLCSAECGLATDHEHFEVIAVIAPKAVQDSTSRIEFSMVWSVNGAEHTEDPFEK